MDEMAIFMETDEWNAGKAYNFSRSETQNGGSRADDETI
jgi:hypothetical protein